MWNSLLSQKQPCRFRSTVIYDIILSCAWTCLFLLLFGLPAQANSSVFISTNSQYWPAAQNYVLQFTNVVAADAGSDTVVLLLSNGKVVEYTNALGGPLGVPSSFTNVAAISTWDTFSCMALRSNGTVSVWGYNSSLQAVPQSVSNVTAIAAGWENCLALRSNGTVVSWGDITNVPPGLSNVVSIAAGDDNNLALQANGTVVEWGPRASDVPIDLCNVIAVSAGWGGNTALLANGTVVSWNRTSTNVLAGITNAVAISQGYSYGSGASVLVLQADGSVVLSGQSTTFSQPLSNVFHISQSAFTSVDTVITGDGSPVFTVQPGNQSVATEDTIYLHARTVGIQPIALQWQHSGTNIPGATNGDLILTNISAAAGGTYQALASSSVGQAVSSTATVTISTVRRAVLLSAPILQSDGNIVMTAETPDGGPFPIASLSSVVLEASGDLNQWNVVTNGLSLTNGAILFNNSAAANNVTTFYRLRRQ